MVLNFIVEVTFPFGSTMLGSPGKQPFNPGTCLILESDKGNGIWTGMAALFCSEVINFDNLVSGYMDDYKQYTVNEIPSKCVSGNR